MLIIAFSILSSLAVLLAVLVLGCGLAFRLLPGTANSSGGLLIVIAFGVFALALAGFLIALSPFNKTYSAVVIMAISLAFSIVSCRLSSEFNVDFIWRSWKVPVLLWVTMIGVATLISYVDVKRPKELFDGPYVFKTWSLPVRIQSLCNDLPPDNALPAVVTEYLVRGISFKKEHPIMPGQEVSNRPILMSLAAVPARVLLGEEKKQNGDLPRFTYVGQQWPDTLSLVDSATFRRFLITAIPLNACTGVAFYVLLGVFNINFRKFACLVFIICSPYVILHTVYTWPKNLAAFFLISSVIIFIFDLGPSWVVGVLLAMAYWAHPYAIAFVPCVFGVAWLTRKWSRRGFLLSVSIFFALLAPWFIWTKFIVGLPADLVAQNFSAAKPIVYQLWVRIHNAQSLFLPGFLSTFPYQADTIIRNYFISLSAPLGIFLLFVPAGLVLINRKQEIYLAVLIFVPGIILISVFSGQAVPLLHGWQAVWPSLAVLTLAFAQRFFSKRWVVIVLSFQFLLNLTMLYVWLNNVSNF